MMFGWLMKHADECSYKDKQLLDTGTEVAPIDYYQEVDKFLYGWNHHNVHANLHDISIVVEEL